MTSVPELQAGIAANLSTISRLSASATVPATPSPPCAIILPATPFIEYEQSFDPDPEAWFNFTIRVLVGAVDQKGAQLLLNSYLASSGSASIRAALLADRTLGGKANDLRVPTVSNYGGFVYSETTFLGAEFSVQVYA